MPIFVENVKHTLIFLLFNTIKENCTQAYFQQTLKYYIIHNWEQLRGAI